VSPNPLVSLDRQRVLTALAATGSRDPDVLYAAKTRLIRDVRLPHRAGSALILIGGALVATLVRPLVGLGVAALLLGGWLRRHGARNIGAVEAGYQEYVRRPG